jgi:hypothetical protein
MEEDSDLRRIRTCKSRKGVDNERGSITSGGSVTRILIYPFSLSLSMLAPALSVFPST